MPDTCDLIVLGSGSGGYVAAVQASQLEMKVAIVEGERLNEPVDTPFDLAGEARV